MRCLTNYILSLNTSLNYNYFHRLIEDQLLFIFHHEVVEVSISCWIYRLRSFTFDNDHHNDVDCVRVSHESFWSQDNHTIPWYLQKSLYFAICLLSSDFWTAKIIWLIDSIRYCKPDSESTSFFNQPQSPWTPL